MTVHHGDAFELLPTMPGYTFDAIVTSPPYADLRPIGVDPDGFAEWLRPILAQARRLLAPAGSMMLNLGPIHRGGFEHPYIDDTIAAARELGLGVLDTIVWVKTNGMPPSSRQLHRRHEFVYWLGTSPHAYRGFDENTRPPHAELALDRYTRKLTKQARDRRGSSDRSGLAYGQLHPDGARPPSVIATPVGRVRGLGHTAPMALELATYLVALACPPDGLVLDPFCGAGTTGVACQLLGRRFVGVEIDERSVDVSRRRLAQMSLLESSSPSSGE